MDANIAAPAALIADPTRAAILNALLDGRAQPAGALAWAAGVTATAASNHLARLVEGGLLVVEPSGRHRYYRLAGPQVAHAVEALACLSAPIRDLTTPRSPKARAMRQARTCYGHLAGQLGVAVAEALEARGLIVAEGERLYAVTPTGRDWFRALGVEVEGLKSSAGVARRCLDWTERRHHLAGPLGVAMTGRMIALGWLKAAGHGRALSLTPRGAAALAEQLGISDAEATRAA